jgi:hypothetical protein
LTPSARSANLIAGDGMKNGLSRSEQRTVRKTQNNRLTEKAPYKSAANLTFGDAVHRDGPLGVLFGHRRDARHGAMAWSPHIGGLIPSFST